MTVNIVALIKNTFRMAFGRSGKWTGLLIFAWVATAWMGTQYYLSHLATHYYERELQVVRQRTQAIGSNIDQDLQVLKGIPLVFSGQETVLSALRRFGAIAPPSALAYQERKQRWTGDAQLGALNKSLNIAASSLLADVLWIVDASGDCIAASNAGKQDSFVGYNYADRDYFIQPRAGQRGRQYAVGRASKIPGLYYSVPVIENGHFLGAVVVKRNIKKIISWSDSANAFLSDMNGVIILASDARLEFRALPDAAIGKLSNQQRMLQYERSRFDTLDIAPWGARQLPLAMRFAGGNTPVLLTSKVLSEDAMVLHLALPLTELARFNNEKDWAFLLLALGGSMLIVAVSASLFYVRQLHMTKADLHVAATAFESQEAMMVTDMEGVILKVNRAFSTITGYSAGQAIGKKTGMLRSDQHDKAFYAAMSATILRGGAWEGELVSRRQSGTLFPGWLTVTGVRSDDDKTSRLIFILSDITDRKAKEEEIRQLAFYDPLTHLPNRRLLIDRLHHAMATSIRSTRHGALLFIDLDNFKTINDTLGHGTGDRLLQNVAERLSGCVRAGDTVARQGGDEFVILLGDLSEVLEDALTQTEIIGEKILEALNRPYLFVGHVCHNSASIGATVFNGETGSTDEQLRRADHAMYRAKAAGRNTFHLFDRGSKP